VINQIKIKRFQSHKETILDLCGGVNIIKGDPNSGKTPIIRGLRWLRFNRPKGFRFHSDFTKEESTIVEVKVDGNRVGLEKDSLGAIYNLNDEKFEKFGTDIPDKIIEALNLTKLNFTNQFDLPFLTLDSPGEVGRVLNRITRLDKVDEWVSNLTSKINGENREIRILKEQMEGLDNKLARLKYLFELEKELEKLEESQDKLVELNKRETEIKEVWNAIKELKLDIESEREWLKVEKDLKELEEVEEKLKGLEGKEKLLKESQFLLKQISIYKMFIEMEKGIVECERIVEELNNKRRREDSLIAWLLQRKGNKDGFFKAEAEFAEAKINYKNLLIEIGICPVCSSEINKECINRIMEEL